MANGICLNALMLSHWAPILSQVRFSVPFTLPMYNKKVGFTFWIRYQKWDKILIWYFWIVHLIKWICPNPTINAWETFVSSWWETWFFPFYISSIHNSSLSLSISSIRGSFYHWIPYISSPSSIFCEIKSNGHLKTVIFRSTATQFEVFSIAIAFPFYENAGLASATKNLEHVLTYSFSWRTSLIVQETSNLWI